MPSHTSIRIATADDIPAIVAVVNPAFQVEIFLSGTRTDEKNVADHMQKGEFLVMEDGSGRIISSVYVELRGERGYFGMLAVEQVRVTVPELNAIVNNLIK